MCINWLIYVIAGYIFQRRIATALYFGRKFLIKYTLLRNSVGYLFQIVNKNCLENQTSSLCEKVKLYAIAVTMYGPK